MHTLLSPVLPEKIRLAIIISALPLFQKISKKDDLPALILRSILRLPRIARTLRFAEVAGNGNIVANAGPRELRKDVGVDDFRVGWNE